MRERSMTEELTPRAALVSEDISVSIHVFPYKSPLFACINLNDILFLVIKRIELKLRGTAIITWFFLVDHKIIG